MVNGAVSNGVASADSAHLEYAAVCNGESSFKLRSTFASGDPEYHGDASMVTVDDSMTKISGKDSRMTTWSGRLKKGNQKRSEGDSISPLRRGRRDAKPRSEKKLSLGRRKGSGKSKKQAAVTLADLAHSVPRMSTEDGEAVSGMESPSMRNGSLKHVEWVRHGSMELELADSTPESRKSYSQEEESSLSECKRRLVIVYM